MGLLKRIRGERDAAPTVADYQARIDELHKHRAEKFRMVERLEAKVPEEILTSGTSISSKQRDGFRREIADLNEVIGKLEVERDALRVEEAAKDEAGAWEITAALAREVEQDSVYYQELLDEAAAAGRALEKKASALLQSAPHIRADFDRTAFVLNLPTLARDRLEGRNFVNGRLARTIVEVAKEFTAMVLALKPKDAEPKESNSDSSQPTESASNNL